MELHAKERGLLVADAHNLSRAVRGVTPGAHLEFVAQRARLDDETVVARGLERVLQALVEVPAVVVNHVRLAVHQPPGADDSGPKSLGDGLVSQADTQQWDLSRKMPGTRHGDARLVRRAGARRDDQVGRAAGLDLLHRDLVVAVDL